MESRYQGLFFFHLFISSEENKELKATRKYTKKELSE